MECNDDVKNAIITLEKNGYWVDLEHREIREVEGVPRFKKIECLNSDNISNKCAVLTYLINKYKSFGNAVTAGYPGEAINHAVDVLNAEKEGINNTPPKQNSGKTTYVCSDIHGMYGTYCDVIKEMKKDDELFILGDVIDRGKNGIKIIQDIMKRKSPEVTLFLGNHEYMMIQSLDIIRKYDLTCEDIDPINSIFACFNHLKNLKLDSKMYSKEKLDEKRKEYEDRIKTYKQKGNCSKLTDDEIATIANWGTLNGGKGTLDDYMMLAEREQEDIYNFLVNRSIFGNINRNGKNYLLVHSRPIFNEELVETLKNGECFWSYKSLKENPKALRYLLSKRDEDDPSDPYAKYKKEGFITICGHEPASNVEADETRGVIRIDTGCGHNSKGDRLTLLRLGNEEVQFRGFEQKENEDFDER